MVNIKLIRAEDKPHTAQGDGGKGADTGPPLLAPPTREAYTRIKHQPKVQLKYCVFNDKDRVVGGGDRCIAGVEGGVI